MKSLQKLILAAAAFAVVSVPPSALACAACFGKTDSPMAKAMNAGIFVLLGVIGSVLVGAASFFVFLAKKAATVHAQEAADAAKTSEAGK